MRLLNNRIPVYVFAGERLMIRISSLFLAATLPLLCQQRQLSGVIVDPSSHPVPNATITCGGKNAISNAEGRFTIEAPESCEASVDATGFESARITLEPGKEARVLLAISPLNERVVVSATRTPINVEESGVAATVFTSRVLEDRQFAPVLDVLRDVPGLSIAASGRRGAITSIFTRGGASTSTLVLLDGVPLNEPGGQIDLANLTTTGLDRIEVVRGAESALFGAEAAAGVVQLFSSRGDTKSVRPRGSIFYERGNFQTDHWSANLNGGVVNRIDYSLTGDQFHTTGMFPNDFYRNTTGTANIGFRFNAATQVRAAFRELDSEAGNPGQVGFGAYNFNASGANRDTMLSLRLEDARGSHFVQRVSFGYHRLRNLGNDAGTDAPIPIAALIQRTTTPVPRVYLVQLLTPSPSIPADPRPGFSVVQSTSYDFESSFVAVTHRKNFEYQGVWTHTGGALVFGYRYERQAGIISNTDVGRNNNGGFVHEQYSIGKRLFLTGGARFENSTTFGSRFVPRGSATFQLFGGNGASSTTLLRVSAARGFTEPSLLENFARESFYIGNPSLKPEKTAMFDAGIVEEMFSRRVRLEASYFRNSFTDLIVFDSRTFPSSWSNIDRSWARGVEASGSVRLMKYLQLAGNYTRLYTKITRTNSTNIYSGLGQELPRRPKDSGTAWVAIAPRRWTLMFGGRAIGERQDSDFFFGISRNPGYGTMFLNGAFNLTKHVTPYVRIDNLLDERYEEVLGYTALGRSAIGGLRLTW